MLSSSCRTLKSRESMILSLCQNLPLGQEKWWFCHGISLPLSEVKRENFKTRGFEPKCNCIAEFGNNLMYNCKARNSNVIYFGTGYISGLSRGRLAIFRPASRPMRFSFYMLWWWLSIFKDRNIFELERNEPWVWVLSNMAILLHGPQVLLLRIYGDVPCD